MTEPTEELQDLLQLLYMAPVGLIRVDFTGNIELANAVAAQLLMPLSADGQMVNLFRLLDGVLPQLGSQVASFSPSHGVICDSVPIRVNSSASDRPYPTIFSLTVTKIDDRGLVASLSDISEESRMAMQIADSEARMRALLDAALDAIISTDADGRISDWNKQAERMFGWSRDDVIGKMLLDTIAPAPSRMEQETVWVRLLASAQAAPSGRHVELAAMQRGGLKFPAELSLVPFEMKGVHYTTVFISDITDRKRANDRMRQLAYYDPLTGLANRTLLDDRLTQAMLLGERSKCASALMLLDLDGFKQINDLHGHHMGDLLLVEVARRLKSCVREIDTVARLGGDEFVVLLSDLNVRRSDPSNLSKIVAEKIRVSLSSPYRLTRLQTTDTTPTPELHCSASIGVVTFVGRQTKAADIFERADGAMYEAKMAGRNRIRFYGVTE